jgi:membrane protease YdiL (CAAX protease family)
MKSKNPSFRKASVVFFVVNLLLAFIWVRLALWHYNQSIFNSSQGYDFLYLLFYVPLVGSVVYSIKFYKKVPGFWKLVMAFCILMDLLAGCYILLLFGFSGPGW